MTRNRPMDHLFVYSVFSFAALGVVYLVGYTASYPEDEELELDLEAEEDLEEGEDSSAWEAFDAGRTRNMIFGETFYLASEGKGRGRKGKGEWERGDYLSKLSF